MTIKNIKDFYSSLIFMFFGIATMVFAPSYQIGTAARMGPGFFPFALGGMLTMLGLVISLRSLSWGRGGRKTLSFQTRPVVFVLCSVILFGLVLRPLGLLLSTIILVLVSSMASYDFKVRQSILTAFVLLAIVLIIFVFFLKFQIPVWPSFLAGRT
jgi:hypothetical protein